MNLCLLFLIAIGNITLIVYLILDHNRKIKGNSDSEKPPAATENPPEEPSSTANDMVEDTSIIGKSSFDIDRLDAYIEERINKSIDERVDARVNQILDDKIGDVKTEDVEFAPEEERQSDIFVPKPRLKPFVPLSDAETRAAFDEDLRYEDVVTDEVSAPDAKCASIDEIEAAVETAVNPEATDTQKAEAGKVLNEQKDTELYARLSERESIRAGLEESIRLSLEAEMAEKSGYRHKPKRINTVNDDSVADSKSKFNDGFDPDDLV